MGAFTGKAAFEMPESPRGGIFVPKSDCRGFSIRIPSGEFMRYVKSVKGSPMSVFYVCFARALQRVHPEIDWYQGFHGEDYVLAMRDVLQENGIKGIAIERIE